MNQPHASQPSPPFAPWVDPSAFVAQGTQLIGAVAIGAQSSIWFNCVLRGDVQPIAIGERSNLQDGTIVHGTTNGLPTIVGDDVTVGHGAILHACTLEDGAFVGFGARVLDGAVVKSGGMLAAGAVLTPHKVVGTGELWAGNPARLLRMLTDDERAGLGVASARYVALIERYRRNQFVTLPF
ncbi:gamma carbonic anhydrase family protein [Pandoraea pneumonica]|uniref:Gamma carbonic anhydrase family protein n=1 Tax=Pandoraea pneumonica TaxID=2508299 RepID=A0A5E4SLG6_9BURK|nr:gamma carbonic anhydrase family protein [Pandoraea pneumonica]VVD75702.1 gamma carbonic anhydrase family protein [Pandoraea pneumonica]